MVIWSFGSVREDLLTEAFVCLEVSLINIQLTVGGRAQADTPTSIIHGTAVVSLPLHEPLLAKRKLIASKLGDLVLGWF